MGLDLVARLNSAAMSSELFSASRNNILSVATELKYVMRMPEAKSISTTTAVILVRSDKAGVIDFTLKIYFSNGWRSSLRFLCCPRRIFSEIIAAANDQREKIVIGVLNYRNSTRNVRAEDEEIFIRDKS